MRYIAAKLAGCLLLLGTLWKYAFFYFISPNQEQLRKYATIGTLAGIEPDSVYLYLIVYVNATTRQHAWYNPWTTYTHISQPSHWPSKRGRVTGCHELAS